MLVSYWSIIMVKLSPVDKARAIGQLEAGKSQTEVAATFGVTQGMISKLKTKFDRRCERQTKKWPSKEDRNRRVTAPELQRRYRHRYGTDLSAQAIRNRLRQILVQEWNAIPQHRVRTLVSSMRRRCQAVAAAYGGSTRYFLFIVKLSFLVMS